MNRPRLVSTRTDTPNPLADQRTIALSILAFGAEAASRFRDGADTLDELPPYLRAQLRQLSVAVAASVESITDKLSKNDRP